MKTIKSYYKEHLEKNRKVKRLIFITLSVLIIISIFIFAKMYKAIMNPNVETNENYSLYIYENDSFENIKEILYSDSVIINKKSFEWLAKKLDYPQYIKSGHYVIKDGMNNNQLLNMLRSGSQTPVRFTFNNIRTIEQLASRIDEQLELDSLDFINAVNNNDSLKEMGFNSHNYASLFIPNTYELYWNISAEDFIEKMINEYKRFWNESRLEKAEKIKELLLESE